MMLLIKRRKIYISVELYSTQEELELFARFFSLLLRSPHVRDLQL